MYDVLVFHRLTLCQELHDAEGTCEAFVMEDTFISNAEVTFDTIYQETHNKGSGGFGYGGYKRKINGNIAWNGSKGLYLMQPWWEDMAVVLENSSLADFRHWDLWLGHRQRNCA